MEDRNSIGAARFWIFQARSDVFPLKDNLIPDEVDQWRLLRFKDRVKSGDVVYLWLAGGEDTVMGWGTIEGEPYPDTNKPRESRVPVRYRVRLKRPLQRTALRGDRWLRFLSILRAPQGVNFSVTAEQAVVLNAMIAENGEETPPYPQDFPHQDLLLDHDLSSTTRKVVTDAGHWTTTQKGEPGALSSTLFLFSLIRNGLGSSREFLDTSRFIAQHWTEPERDLEQAQRIYFETWKDDPELDGCPSSPDEPLATIAARLVLDAAERIALATTGEARVSLRHLLGALLESDPLSSELGAQKVIQDAGLSLREIRREFIGYIRQYHGLDNIGEWQKVLLARNESISLLHGYSADLPEGEDQLEIQAEVDAFASLIASTNLKPPISIGLFGDWGSGKSFFMKKIIERVTWICNNVQPKPQGEKADFYKNIVQIEFNAWHYSESNLWASLVTHIFNNLKLSLDGDTQTEAEKRRELLLNELDERKKLKAEAEDELKEVEDQRKEAKKEFDDKKTQADKDMQNYIEILKADPFDDPNLTVPHRELIDEAGKILGFESAERSAREIYDLVREARTLKGKSEALGLSIINSENWKGRLLWLGGFVISFLLLLVLVNTLRIWEDNETFQQARTLLTFLASFVSVGAAWLRKHIAQAQKAIDSLQAVDEAFTQKIEEKQKELDADILEQKDTLDKAQEAEDEARQRLAAIDAEIAEKEKEIRDLEPDRRMARFIEERALSTDYRMELGILSLIRQDFEKLTRFLSGKESGEEDKPLAIDRIILYIDDLDRCPKETVVKVLQAIHLLLAFELFVVVVAVDTRWIRRSLSRSYGGLILDNRPHVHGSEQQVRSTAATSEDYLEKIFQVPFWIRPMNEGGARRLVGDLLKDDFSEPPVREEQDGEEQDGTDGGEAIPVPPPQFSVPDRHVEGGGSDPSRRFRDPSWLLQPQRLSISEPEQKVIDQLTPLIGRSPRAVKRFINVYRILRAGLVREELAAFLGEDPSQVEYPAALLLLATLNGSPALATDLFKALADSASKGGFASFLKTYGTQIDQSQKTELDRYLTLLTPYLETWGKRPQMEIYQKWAPRAARYSFRMEMAKPWTS